MMPPAMRKAVRLMPSARSRSSPSRAKKSRMPAAISTERTAIARRCAAVAPAVRLAKIGAQPGGSITTRKVTKAETNSSITGPPAAAGRRGACAATRVLRSRTAMVIGPTPPGTGVIAPATSLALAKSTSPTSLPLARPVDADVDHGRAGLQPVALDHLRPADGGDDDVGAADDGRQVAGAAVGDGDGAILARAAAAPSACRRCSSGRSPPPRARKDRRAGP